MDRSEEAQIAEARAAIERAGGTWHEEKGCLEMLLIVLLVLIVGVCAPARDGVKDLSQNVDEQTRYFRFWDCALEQWMQSSVDAACTLEIR